MAAKENLEVPENHREDHNRRVLIELLHVHKLHELDTIAGAQACTMVDMAKHPCDPMAH